MNIFFLNECRYTVLISVEASTSVEIQPYQKASVTCEANDKLNISIRRDIVSYKEKSNYIMILESQYCFTNVKNGEEFKISREKIRVNLNVYYDRLFLTAKQHDVIWNSIEFWGRKG